ncbi:T9SS type B sorting domain-containing protein [Flavobacterium humidisoli]|uniref:T9SS type B sorting domain-containing protein n=1 Tax=Flavobacterium humidisoli TaxID=2937442 RepID=A0ABY4LXP1_9FLAO|nr:T9SS type B sorting domain-containing protein [Flavobacterium humidisoli]UPZ17843.1 T9SS type B sorting domain-containing protein [Flavobacterium humidisoli]
MILKNSYFKTITNALFCGSFFAVSNLYAQCDVNTVNNDFEEPLVSISAEMVAQANVPGWKTTAPDGIIEFWKNGSMNGTAYSGNQYIELNAYFQAGVYQDYDSAKNKLFNFSFAHKGRAGRDEMVLKAGPPGGPYTIITTASTDNVAWKVYSGNYTVPLSQNTTRFIFEAIKSFTNDPTVGNFLDAINFASALKAPIVSGDLNVCSGNSATLKAVGEIDSEIKWFDSQGNILYIGETFITPIIISDTKFKVMQINSKGCQSSLEDVEVKLKIKKQIIADNAFSIKQLSSESGIDLIVESTNWEKKENLFYQLDDGDFTSSNKFFNVPPGIHKVTIQYSGSCEDYNEKVLVIHYPRFFTPNGDGYNDIWDITKFENMPTLKNLSIFDRFGKLVKKNNSYGIGWDGNYNGVAMPSSDYWFIFEYTHDGSSKIIKSHFALKR